jgi:hypothetical protein
VPGQSWRCGSGPELLAETEQVAIRVLDQKLFLPDVDVVRQIVVGL